ncbi:MAG: phenylalanine--tRNA ligase subunit beta, partial [Acidimicrobiales bacterium]
VTVDAGASEQLEIVCGAWNFSEGAVVPLAPVGSVLPGGMKIAKRKVKGVASNGMLCSGKELELSEDGEGILLLDGEPEPGTPLTEALGIEADVVFDLEVAANRPDAASVAGVARDLAARLHLPFSIPEPSCAASSGSPAAHELVSLEVRDLDLCPRFTARVINGVVVGASPSLVARRLLLAGMRPINNVVDASNYAMIELGQPTHPYDLDLVSGEGLIVRAGRQGETVVTLDGNTRVVGSRSIVRGDDLRDCLICDARNDAIGIGGVMGGATSEIGTTTTRVLLEAAYFTPMAIARTSKRLGLRTEASSRFERGVDPLGVDRAATRVCELLAHGDSSSMALAPGVVDVMGSVPEPVRVRVRTVRVNAVLGADLSDDEVASCIEPIGFSCDVVSPGELEVEVPTFRPDTEREIDVIEEVARHHGYNRLPRRSVFPPQVGRLSSYQRERRFVREALAGTGAHEASIPSLLAPGDHERAGLGQPGTRELTIANPLTPEESVLRRSLLPGMLKVLSFNASRREGSVRLFEIGHVFPGPSAKRLDEALRHERASASVVDEREMLGVLLARENDDARAAVGTWLELSDALGIEGVGMVAPSEKVPLGSGGMHATRSANLVIGPSWSAQGPSGGGTVIGVVGEIDHTVLGSFGIDSGRRAGWLEVDLGSLLGTAPRKPPVVAPVSRFPSNDIDLAFVVDDVVPAAAVASTLAAAGGDLLESFELFDVYRG